ncbi:hypothetical protein GGF37_007466, partial [Kickxella alabastrina]
VFNLGVLAILVDKVTAEEVVLLPQALARVNIVAVGSIASAGIVANRGVAVLIHTEFRRRSSRTDYIPNE